MASLSKYIIPRFIHFMSWNLSLLKLFSFKEHLPNFYWKPFFIWLKNRVTSYFYIFIRLASIWFLDLNISCFGICLYLYIYIYIIYIIYILYICMYFVSNLNLKFCSYSEGLELSQYFQKNLKKLRHKYNKNKRKKEKILEKKQIKDIIPWNLYIRW